MFRLFKNLPHLGCHTSIEVRTEVQKAARLAEGWSLVPPSVPPPVVEAGPVEAVAPTVDEPVEDAPKKRGRPRKDA